MFVLVLIHYKCFFFIVVYIFVIKLLLNFRYESLVAVENFLLSFLLRSALFATFVSNLLNTCYREADSNIVNKDENGSNTFCSILFVLFSDATHIFAYIHL